VDFNPSLLDKYKNLLRSCLRPEMDMLLYHTSRVGVQYSGDKYKNFRKEIDPILASNRKWLE
jgi:hypothetical protein